MACTCTSSLICGDDHIQRETHHGEIYDTLQLLAEAVERVDNVVGDDISMLSRRKQTSSNARVFHTCSQNMNSSERLTSLQALVSGLQSIVLEYEAFKLAYDNKQIYEKEGFLRSQTDDYDQGRNGLRRENFGFMCDSRPKDIYNKRPRAETTDKSDMSKRATTMNDYVTSREQPGEEIENPMGADQRAGNYGTKNDKLDITIQIISLCLTEEAPVYGQRSGLPAFLQLQLAGQTEVVGRFDLAPDPDTVVEINATTVLPLSPEIQAAILSAFARGSYCDMVFSVCLENSGCDLDGAIIVLVKAGFRFLRILDVNLEPEKVDLTLRRDRMSHVKVGTITIGIRALSCLRKLCYPDQQR